MYDGIKASKRILAELELDWKPNVLSVLTSFDLGAWWTEFPEEAFGRVQHINALKDAIAYMNWFVLIFLRHCCSRPLLVLLFLTSWRRPVHTTWQRKAHGRNRARVKISWLRVLSYPQQLTPSLFEAALMWPARLHEARYYLMPLGKNSQEQFATFCTSFFRYWCLNEMDEFSVIDSLMMFWKQLWRNLARYKWQKRHSCLYLQIRNVKLEKAKRTASRKTKHRSKVKRSSDQVVSTQQAVQRVFI